MKPTLATTWLMAAVLLACCFGLAAYNIRPPVDEAPRVIVAPSSGTLDLGVGKPNEVLQGKLDIRNVGGRPLTFRVSASCGCTRVEPRQGSVAPGKDAQVSLAVRLPEYSNSEKTVQIEVHTNDPDHPVVARVARARAPAPFLTTCPYVDFGSVTTEEAAAQCRTFDVTIADDTAPLDLAKLSIANESPCFCVSSDTADPKRRLVRVGLCATEEGELFDTIVCQLPDTPDLLRIPVHARISKPVSIVPSTVIVRSDERSGQAGATVIVVSRSPKEHPVPAVGLRDPPPGIHLQTVDADQSRRTLRLVVDDGARLTSPFVLRLYGEGLPEDLTLTVVQAPRSTPRLGSS